MENYRARLAAGLAGVTLFLTVWTVNSQVAPPLQFVSIGWEDLQPPAQALASIQADAPPAAAASGAPMRVILTKASEIPDLPAARRDAMRKLARQGVPIICQGGERELANLLGVGAADGTNNEEEFFALVWQSQTLHRAHFLLGEQTVQTLVEDPATGEMTPIPGPVDEATGTAEENRAALLGQAVSWAINLGAETPPTPQAKRLLSQSGTTAAMGQPKIGTDTGAWNAVNSEVFSWNGVTQGKVNAVLTLTVNSFKIPDGHADKDWYLVDCRLHHEINKAFPYVQFNILKPLPLGTPYIGFYVNDRSLKIERPAGFPGENLVEYGPTTTVGTSESGFSIGASLDTGGPGINATYSQSFSNPDVAINDTSSLVGNICNWSEGFVCPKPPVDWYWAIKWPTAPAKASWYADYGSIWMTTNTSPSGGLKLKISPSAHMYKDEILFSNLAGLLVSQRHLSYTLGATKEISVYRNWPPAAPQRPSMPSPVQAGRSVAAEVSGGADPDGDLVSYKVDWGDGQGPYGEANQNHVYSQAGTYSVRAKAMDTYGNESPWSESFSVTVTGAPYTPVKAAYSGLFLGTNGVTAQNSGFLTISTTAKGRFSGSLQLAQGRYPISGAFDNVGHAQASSIKANLTVEMQIVPGGPPDTLVGIVSGVGGTAALTANRATYSKANPTPHQGKYTLVIPGSDDAASRPGGCGFGTVSVDAAGNVRFAGTLGDSMKATQSTFMSREDEWPLCVLPYAGKGVMLGRLTFSNEPGEGPNGSVNWLKLAGGKGKYPAGFALQTEATGSAYTPAAPALDFGSGRLVMTGGNLPATITTSISFGANNKLTGANKTAVTVTTTSGLFKGKVVDPTTRKAISVSGVVIQKLNEAYGCFSGATQTGYVYLGPE